MIYVIVQWVFKKRNKIVWDTISNNGESLWALLALTWSLLPIWAPKQSPNEVGKISMPLYR